MKLKKLVADLSLDRQMLQEIGTKNYKAGAAARSCRLSHDDLQDQCTTRVPFAQDQ